MMAPMVPTHNLAPPPSLAQHMAQHARSKSSSVQDDYSFLTGSSPAPTSAALAAQPKTIDHLGLDPAGMLPMSAPYGIFLDTHTLRSSVSVPNLGLGMNMQPIGYPPPMPTIPFSALHQLHGGSGPDGRGGHPGSHHSKEPSNSSSTSSMPALTHSSDSTASSVAGPSSEALVRNSSSQSAQSDYSMTNKLTANRALSVEGFPSRSAFRSVHMAYLSKISFRRDKSLVTPAMYDAVAWYLLCRADGREESIRQLGLEEDTSKGEREREAFKRWCIRTFRLGPGIMPHSGGVSGQMDKQTVLERSALVATTCPGGYSIISIADGKPVAPPAQLYGVLVFCHKRTGHGGRDKTHAFLRRYFANVPKELVQAFIKMCPTCNFKRNRDAPFQDSFDGDVEASSESGPPSSPPPSAPLVLQSAEQWQMSNQAIAPGLHFHHPAGHYHPHPFHYKAPGTLTSPPSLAELQAGTLTSPPSLAELQIGTLTSPPSLSELSERSVGDNGMLTGAVAVSEGGGHLFDTLMNSAAQSTYIAPEFNMSNFAAGMGGGGGGGLDTSSAESGSGLLTPSQYSFLRSPNMAYSSAGGSGSGGGGGPGGVSVFGHHGHAAPAESLQQRLTALALSNGQPNSSSPHAMPSTTVPADMGAGPAANVDWSSILAQLDTDFGNGGGAGGGPSTTGPGASTATMGVGSKPSHFWREGGTPSHDLMLGSHDGEGEVDADATISA